MRRDSTAAKSRCFVSERRRATKGDSVTTQLIGRITFKEVYAAQRLSPSKKNNNGDHGRCLGASYIFAREGEQKTDSGEIAP
jgi:hypothetical protein